MPIRIDRLDIDQTPDGITLLSGELIITEEWLDEKLPLLHKLFPQSTSIKRIRFASPVGLRPTIDLPVLGQTDVELDITLDGG